ncbi:MAG TPA: ABC transporter substrate-binding protein [Chloroflexota bacterium]|nr:ABC transporter substrate-binding protein [Chloroflexota bacterium]
MRKHARAWPVAVLLLASALLGACQPVAPASRPEQAAMPAAGAAAPTRGTAPSALPTTPVVDLKVGVLATSTFGPLFVAAGRGYFQELGLHVELIPTGTLRDQTAPLATGQLQVGAGSSAIANFNALTRQTDVKIVADLNSAGRTEKSTGTAALVVRKDLWDNGTLRGVHDLGGRTIYTQAGEGSGAYLIAARWMQRNGLDPRSAEWTPMTFADVLAAMQNRAIEVGLSAEPLVTAGVERGIHHILATQEEMYPGVQQLYLVYWTGIDRLGPMVGERFMVAYLKGARDYINAFEYGIDQDAIIDILTRETPIKDPAVYRKIKYGWVDPNGVVNPAMLQADAEFYREMGLLAGPVDLSQAFDDRYRQFAVQYLGEYRPPR